MCSGLRPDQVQQLLHPAAAGSPLGATSGWISNGSPMMSPTVIRGFSEVYGSWNTIWMLRRSRPQLAAGQLEDVLALVA